jgi:excisionase family DNA binding protein
MDIRNEMGALLAILEGEGYVLVKERELALDLLEATIRGKLKVQHEQRRGPLYLTVAEVSRVLRCTPETVTRWIKEGRLPASRLPGGRAYRIYCEDVNMALSPVKGGEKS